MSSSSSFFCSSYSIRKLLLLVVIYPAIAFSSPSTFGSGAFTGPIHSASSTPTNSQSPISAAYSVLLGLRGGDSSTEQNEKDGIFVDEKGSASEGGEGELHLEIDQEGEGDSFQDSPRTTILRSFTVPMASIFTKFGKAYAKSLQTSPIATKSFTAGAIFALSDVTAQKIEISRSTRSSSDKKNDSSTAVQKYDWNRTIGAGLVGLLYFGPAAHYWYSWVFKILPNPGLVSTLQKAALGQLIFGPIFTCVFFASALIQSNTFSIPNWFDKIKSDLFPAWLGGICFWPFVDLISYGFIPQNYIPLFVNFCSFIWTIYLSSLANK